MLAENGEDHCCGGSDTHRYHVPVQGPAPRALPVGLAPSRRRGGLRGRLDEALALTAAAQEPAEKARILVRGGIALRGGRIPPAIYCSASGACFGQSFCASNIRERQQGEAILCRMETSELRSLRAPLNAGLLPFIRIHGSRPSIARLSKTKGATGWAHTSRPLGDWSTAAFDIRQISTITASFPSAWTKACVTIACAVRLRPGSAYL